MENNKIEKNDCGCDSDCCQPSKGKLWKKIFFVVIISAAVTIVTVKLVGKNNTELKVGTDTISAQQKGCCDTSSIKGCVKITNPSNNKSCCPKSN